MAASRMRPSFARACLCRGLVIDLVMEGAERVIEGDETKKPRQLPTHDTPMFRLGCSTAVQVIGTQTTKQGAQQHIDIYVKAGGERVMRASSNGSRSRNRAGFASSCTVSRLE